MAIKLTPRRETFARAWIEEKHNASAAYRRAFNTKNMKDETVWNEAHKLLKNPDVAARIKELQEEMTAKHKVTVDSLVEELEQARVIGLSNPKGAGAAVSATMGKAKLLGMIVDKQRQVDKHDNDVKEQTTDREIYKRFILEEAERIKQEGGV